MIPNEDLYILDACLETWGADTQFQMAIGECGEFVTLAGRKVQNRMSNDDLIDEIADVTLMMRQMARMAGEDAVKERIQYKLAKLAKRLEKYDE